MGQRAPSFVHIFWERMETVIPRFGRSNGRGDSTTEELRLSFGGESDTRGGANCVPKIF
jgi:hypothetical protein